jgi:hypothetical protein
VATDVPPSDDERDETPLERLDRNTVELLNELRVVGAGLQVLFGFLLVVPFNARFPRLNGFERGLYIVALVCIATSMVLLIAPTVQHRLLFHLGQKPFLVHTGTRLMVIACVFLGVGLIDIVLLVVKIVIGLTPAIILAALMTAVIGGLWFALPLLRRRALAEEG